MSYLTDSEIASIQHLHQRAPYVIQGVMNTQLSIARHYGGCTFQDCHYKYFTEHDELVRTDVWLTVDKARRKAARAAKAPSGPVPEQLSIG